MSIVDSNHPALREFCEALGLKHVRRLELRISVRGVMLVEAEFYPEEDGVKAMITTIKKYHLGLVDEISGSESSRKLILNVGEDREEK